MTKHVIIYTWGDDKMLGYSKIDGEAEWTMDLPGLPRFMALKCDDEKIEKMVAEMNQENGKVYRFDIAENEDTWKHFHEIRKVTK